MTRIFLALFSTRSCIGNINIILLYSQGEVYICGKKREGLASDEDSSGLRIGLVSTLHFCSVKLLEYEQRLLICEFLALLTSDIFVYDVRGAGISECSIIRFINCSRKRWLYAVSTSSEIVCCDS